LANSPRKQTLFISRSAPYSSDKAARCLDSVLAAAVFEQPLSYLFLEDGVLQLITGQSPESLPMKSFANALTALPLDGVDALFVSQSALKSRKLSKEDLINDASLAVTLLDDKAVATMIRDSENVVAL